MIVENFDNNFSVSEKHSFPKKSLLSKVIESIEDTPQYFLQALLQLKGKSLNEDELTQVFVEQNNAVICESYLPFLANVEYRDLIFGSKGRPDIYYFPIEKGNISAPLFIMEAKRLPAPEKTREKEYVISSGKKSNGGIERFKKGIHGEGLSEGGMLGYVESGTYEQWKEQINVWIIELVPEWSEKECLIDLRKFSNHSSLKSNVVRKTEPIKLHHFWVKILE